MGRKKLAHKCIVGDYTSFNFKNMSKKPVFTRVHHWIREANQVGTPGADVSAGACKRKVVIGRRYIEQVSD